jgi:hypothetical protein
MPASHVHRTVSFDLKPRIFVNLLVAVLAGAPYRVFRFTLLGLNQSIVSLSLLTKTA